MSLQIVGLKGGLHTSVALSNISDHIHGERLAQAREVEVLFEMQTRTWRCLVLHNLCAVFCYPNLVPHNLCAILCCTAFVLSRCASLLCTSMGLLLSSCGCSCKLLASHTFVTLQSMPLLSIVSSLFTGLTPLGCLLCDRATGLNNQSVLMCLAN